MIRALLCRRKRRKMWSFFRNWTERGRSNIFRWFWRIVTWFGRLFLQLIGWTVSGIFFFPRRALLWLSGNKAEENKETQFDPSVAVVAESGPSEGDTNESDSKEARVNLTNVHDTQQCQDVCCQTINGRRKKKKKKKKKGSYQNQRKSSSSASNKHELDNNCREQSELSAAAGERGTAEEDEDGFGGTQDFPDELSCDYDSTWESEQSQDPPASKRRRNSGLTSFKHQYKFSRFQNAAQDMQNYRHGYPQQIKAHSWKQQSQTNSSPNLEFYLGKALCVPDDVSISDIHHKWFGDYYKLESVHTYIQWLFPLQEPGMNYQASPLTEEEVEAFRQSSEAKQNLLKSYKLMLDFYGIELKDETTGAVKRAANWKNRFDNLNRRTHNNLRLTRILKCLGTLGYPHYQAPLVHFFLEETLVCGELPNVKESVLNYFVFAVLDKDQRKKLIEFAYRNYTPKEEFVWCPRKFQEGWSRKQDAASGAASDHDGEARNNEHDEQSDENSEELV